MAPTVHYAYRLSDFGDGLPPDPIAVARTQARVPVVLARGAEPAVLLLDEESLSEPVEVGGAGFEGGDRAERQWTLADRDKGVTIHARRLVSRRPGGPSLTVLVSVLPLKPGQTYVLSIPATLPEGTVRLPGGLAAGTRVLTEAGKRPIENIACGERIWTEADGFLPVLWHGVQTVPARGLAAPLRLRRGILGLTADLLIAGDHHIRLPRGNGFVLIPAAALEAAGQAVRDYGAAVSWHQLLVRGHGVIFANGLACETLWPGELPVAGRPPDWPADHAVPKVPAHPRLSEAEAAALL
jgi:hypothetical protein